MTAARDPKQLGEGDLDASRGLWGAAVTGLGGMWEGPGGHLGGGPDLGGIWEPTASKPLCFVQLKCRDRAFHTHGSGPTLTKYRACAQK